RQEERFRRLAELSPDAIIVSKGGTVTFANRTAARLIGARTPSDLIGRSLLEFAHPDYRGVVLTSLQRLREGRAFGPEVERFVRLDGSAVEVEVAAIPFVQDEETFVQTVFRDITDRRRAEDALRESEERYRRLVELSPDGIAIHSEGTIVFGNTAAARLLGADSPDQLVGLTLRDVVHPDYVDIVTRRASAQTQLEEPSPLLEEKVIRLDGRVIDVEVAGIPFTYRGRPAGQIVMRDVTDRRQVEAALKQKNEYLAALHQTSLVLMNRLAIDEALEAIVRQASALLSDAHGYIYLPAADPGFIEVRVASGEFRELIGLRMKVGEGLAGRIWGSGRPLVVDDYDSWEGRAPGRAGGRYHAVAGVPITSGSEVVGVLGVVRTQPDSTFTGEELHMLEQLGALASIALDNARLYTAARQELSERERAEQQLREAETRYRALVEQIPAATYTAPFGPVGAWYYVSPHIERILGFSQDEWMARDDMWLSHLVPEDRAPALEAEDHSRLTGAPLVSEYRLIAKDGRIVWIRDEGVVVPGPGGIPVLQGVMFDISESKRAETELERALAREREASERLRVLDEMKNTFLHAVSHELRTPLSSVLGFALTLERDDVHVSAEERRDILGRIAVNARKLDRLLSDLLDMDRLDRGIVEPSRRPIDMHMLVRRIVESAGLTGDREVRVEGAPVVVAVDAPKVERIIENLLANAARHTPHGSIIWVRVDEYQDGVLVTVEDDGPGVPHAVREVIFEPFRQGPDAPAHAPGVGIGLSLVARFAELHGGRAWVEDRAGGGASFRVYLPGSTSRPALQPASRTPSTSRHSS
ncbi:MAG TPA: PAS domain S-box protein, partial [Actinomycetota bacterium]|nr:PAS domain S-box protein [Actinomycetota bacterium]